MAHTDNNYARHRAFEEASRRGDVTYLNLDGTFEFRHERESPYGLPPWLVKVRTDHSKLLLKSAAEVDPDEAFTVEHIYYNSTRLVDSGGRVIYLEQAKRS